MSIQMVGRCSVALCLLALAAGCSSGGAGSRSVFNKCTWSPSACDYEGPYDQDEDSYAEDEAKRLNEAEAAKMRRSSGR